MKLNLKNIEKALPKELVLLAKKNKVRECDETEKGHFIAYVDEGKKSFDVSVTVSDGKEVTEHTCDCPSVNDICRHMVALMMHVAKGKEPEKAVKAKKKTNPAEALLENVDADALKDWVRDLIGKNKDTELSFIHYFSPKEQLTPDDVKKIMGDAVKAVAGGKKSIDLTQLKKLVELWTETLAPVTDSYLANVTDEKSFVNFHTMLEGYGAYHFSSDTNSNKVQKLIEGNLQKSAECINNLFSEEAWDTAVGYYLARIPDGCNKIRMQYVIHLKNIIDVSNEERRLKLIDLLAKQFGYGYSTNLFNGAIYCKVVFGIIAEYGLFPKYHRLFEPLRYENEYNLKLIGLLIENNDLNKAKEICKKQIGSNIRDEFNVPYLKFLKEIYTVQKDDANLAKVLEELFPMSFDFDDYLFITSRMAEEEAKKWRTRMLSRATTASHNGNLGAMRFCFWLMDHEQKYKKMIDYIDSYCSYRVVLKYFEPMVLTDRSRLLDALFRKSDEYYWRRQDEQDELACFPELFRLALKYYSADILQKAIDKEEKDRWYYSSNKLISYIRTQLNPESDK